MRLTAKGNRQKDVRDHCISLDLRADTQRDAQVLTRLYRFFGGLTPADTDPELYALLVSAEHGELAAAKMEKGSSEESA